VLEWKKNADIQKQLKGFLQRQTDTIALEDVPLPTMTQLQDPDYNFFEQYSNRKLVTKDYLPDNAPHTISGSAHLDKDLLRNGGLAPSPSRRQTFKHTQSFTKRGSSSSCARSRDAVMTKVLTDVVKR